LSQPDACPNEVYQVSGVIKPFLFVTDAFSKKARAFFPGSVFQASLLLASKARAYPQRENPIVSHSEYPHGLTRKYFYQFVKGTRQLISVASVTEIKVVKLWRQILLQCWAKMPTDRPTFEALKDFLMETAPSVVKAVQSFQEENKLVSLNIYSIKETI